MASLRFREEHGGSAHPVAGRCELGEQFHSISLRLPLSRGKAREEKGARETKPGSEERTEAGLRRKSGRGRGWRLGDVGVWRPAAPPGAEKRGRR